MDHRNNPPCRSDSARETALEADSQATFATADGIAVGTIDYMSPEQACGKEVDGRSDLYSLACAMYHLMTGLLAFPGESPIERLGRRINGNPVPLADVLPNAPKKLVAVMDRLMANKPSDRYQTAEEAAEALQSLTRRRSAPKPAPAPSAGAVTVAPQAVPADGPSAIAPAAPAPTQAAAEAAYPRWFEPLATFAERSPAGALATLAGTLAAVFLIGLLAGWALF